MSHSHLDAPGTKIPTYAGVGSALAIAVGTLWLGATGQLTLYINPGTVWFAMTMSVVVIVLVLLALVVPHHEHEHEADVSKPSATAIGKHVDNGAGYGKAPRHARSIVDVEAPALQRELGARYQSRHSTPEKPSRHRDKHIGSILGTTAAFVVATVAVLLVPPSSLSAQAAQQRATTSLTSQLTSAQQRVLMGSDTSKFTVVDWANLISTGASSDFVVGKRASMIGFVGADRTHTGTFDLTRFVITCCALDAQPVSLSVASDEWQSSLKSGAWVRVTGTFVTKQGTSASASSTVFRASSITHIKKPAQPYVF